MYVACPELQSPLRIHTMRNTEILKPKYRSYVQAGMLEMALKWHVGKEKNRCNEMATSYIPCDKIAIASCCVH